MTIKTRLLIVILTTLVLTMGIWGGLQIAFLDRLLTTQQIKRLTELAETINTYYQHFPTRRGLAALDMTLKDHVLGDPSLARIDLFTLQHGEVEFVAGAGRISYDWPDNKVIEAIQGMKRITLRMETEGGPAMGVLIPWANEQRPYVHAVAIIGFSQGRHEVLNRATTFLLFTMIGVVGVILSFIFLAFDRLIRRPLQKVMMAIDHFQEGEYRDRIPITRNDELGVVAEHFNAMADEIERVMARNEELTHHLEQRVQEETGKVVQLQNQVNQLQRLTAMGYLMATLAHDLGTPLHSIAGLVELLLEKGNWPPDAIRKLELILQQARRLNLTIQNMRRMTRLPEPHFELVSCEELLKANLPLVESLLMKRNISVSLFLEEGLPSLFVDPYRFQTALLNIVQNAAEAIGNRPGNIAIRVTWLAAQECVSIAVKDDGEGSRGY